MYKDVYLCYSQKDKDIANEICSEFDKCGIVYCSRRTAMSIGIDFVKRNIYAIDSSNIFLWIANKESWDTDYVKDELAYAITNKDRVVVSYVTDDFDTRKTLNDPQIEITNLSGPITKLCSQIKKLLGIYKVYPNDCDDIESVENNDDLPPYNPKQDLESYFYPALYLLNKCEESDTMASIVSMESLLDSEKYSNSKMELPCAIGKDNHNDVFMFDLVKAPHLIVNGDVGRGKTNCLYTIITSLLYKMHPAELKMVLIGTKKDELSVFDPIINHFLAIVPDKFCSPIITDAMKAERTLNSLCKFMDQRRELLKEVGARNIKEYNKKFTDRMIPPRGGHGYMPYFTVVIDDYDDFVKKTGKQVESYITRIVHLGCTVGIHLVLSTKSVDNDIISDSLKESFHTRIAFNNDSNQGDIHFLDGIEIARVQCAFIDTSELESVSLYISSQQSYGEPYVLPE